MDKQKQFYSCFVILNFMTHVKNPPPPFNLKAYASDYIWNKINLFFFFFFLFFFIVKNKYFNCSSYSYIIVTTQID